MRAFFAGAGIVMFLTGLIFGLAGKFEVGVVIALIGFCCGSCVNYVKH